MDISKNKFRLTCLFISFVVGGTISWIFSYGLYAATMGILYIFFFGDGDWPKWTSFLFYDGTFFISIALLTAISIVVGWLYFEWIYRNCASEKRNLLIKKWIYVAAVVFLLDSLAFSLHIISSNREMRARQEEKIAQETIVRDSYKIDNILVNKGFDGIEAKVSFSGKLEGRYSLNIYLMSDFTKKDVLRESLELEMPRDQGPFVFRIPMKELNDRYVRYLKESGRIIKFDQKFGFDEKLVLNMELILLNDNVGLKKRVKGFDIKSSKSSVEFNLDILCGPSGCTMKKLPR